jgi:hypothetical protein
LIYFSTLFLEASGDGVAQQRRGIELPLQASYIT